MRSVVRTLMVIVLAVTAGAVLADAIPNWSAPPTWTPTASDRIGGVKGAFATTYAPVPFTPITPCRLADTRTGSGFPAGYGPPSIAGGAQRTFTITGQCGIPTGVSAVSFNFAVWAPVTTGDLRVFPTGGGVPTVSTLNWDAGILALANAAVVPLGTGGAITVQVDGSGTIDLFIDVNGYYTNYANLNQQLFLSGSFNAAAAIVGFNYSNTSGSHGVGGYAGGTGLVHGVQGQIGTTAGTGSSGVHGISPTTATSTYGVFGETASTSIFSAGVYGQTAVGTTNAGYFLNTGNTTQIHTYLSTNGTPTGGVAAPAGNYGVWVNGGHIFATGNIYGTAKNFVAPHPNDPAKEIVYTSVEAPTADIYFRGSARLVNGMAVIQVPEHFRLSARDETYQTNLTLVRSRGNVWVESEGPEGIVVRGPSDATVHYVVYAERSSVEPQEAVRDNMHFNATALSRGDVRGLPETYRELLVRNGTLNRDLTLNKETAIRLGWTIPAGAEAK